MSKKYKFLFLLLLIFFCPFCGKAQATVCQREPTPWDYGQVINYKYRARINTVCAVTHRKGGTSFINMEIIDISSKSINIINRPYELAFRSNIIGKFLIKYKINLLDRYGKEQFVYFVMNLDVVEKSW